MLEESFFGSASNLCEVSSSDLKTPLDLSILRHPKNQQRNKIYMKRKKKGTSFNHLSNRRKYSLYIKHTFPIHLKNGKAKKSIYTTNPTKDALPSTSLFSLQNHVTSPTPPPSSRTPFSYTPRNFI